MRIKTIVVLPGSTNPPTFSEPVDTLQSLISSTIILICLYILKYIIMIHSLIIDNVEDDIIYWKVDLPWWIHDIFMITTIIYIIKVAYFYQKYKKE